MSRADLGRARQLMRLRSLALDTALAELREANQIMERADARVAEALQVRAHTIAAHDASRAALVADPGDHALGLARVAAAAEREAEAIATADIAEDERRAAEDSVLAARLAVRRARARLDAMEGRADRLHRAIARGDEERAAIETEEGAAAMRNAA